MLVLAVFCGQRFRLSAPFSVLPQPPMPMPMPMLMLMSVAHELAVTPLTPIRSFDHDDAHKHTHTHTHGLCPLHVCQVENPGIGTYVSKLRNPEMLPWADWVTKHLIDTYGSLRGVGSARVKETDLVQIKENIG